MQLNCRVVEITVLYTVANIGAFIDHSRLAMEIVTYGRSQTMPGTVARKSSDIYVFFYFFTFVRNAKKIGGHRLCFRDEACKKYPEFEKLAHVSALPPKFLVNNIGVKGDKPSLFYFFLSGSLALIIPDVDIIFI